MIDVRDIGKAAVLAVVLSAGTVLADEAEKESVAVSYAELDLSKPAGAEVFYDRLQRAAAQVCGVRERTSSLFYSTTLSEKKACYQDALDRALAQIDAPLVQAQHSG
jgi:UrcA family protein